MKAAIKTLPLILICAGFCCASAARGDDSAPPPQTQSAKTPVAANQSADRPAPRNQLLSGQVRLLVDVLKSRKIQAYPDETKGQVVLEASSGDLWPIVSDWRGRAFYQDERLRDRNVDLIVRRHAGVPYVQVLSIYTFDEQGRRQYTDYWCDLCSIPMYEIKDCDCCRAPIRLRFQPRELPKNLNQLDSSKPKSAANSKK